jgi:FAD/FMN-containing dehydrogenase
VSDAALESWGRWPRCTQRALALRDRAAALPAFEGRALPRGQGRSYGDSCLAPDGTLLDARALDRFIAFDPASGVLRAEAGTTLAQVLALVVPQGWFLPVTPGTRHVTLGGALANDVHGKNHHAAGSFGDHVSAFELLRSDGTRLLCTPQQNSEWFAATVGGLGLTGFITWVELRLRRIPGPGMEVESVKFGALDEFFALSRESAATHEYTVAWIDCLARGTRLGRGHFLRADHAAVPVAPPRGAPGMPFVPPLSLVNRLTLRPFNALYYHRQRRARQRASVHYAPYFYPLDGIAHWNRMYGPRGFLQHQCVLPPGAAREALVQLLGEIGRSGQGSFLAVLKEFGARTGPGLLSFARPGTTLALDFPHGGDATLALLERLDAIVVAAGGALYPAKDARMSAATFRAGFPRWEEFRRYVDPRFCSGFWRRVAE